MSAPSGIAQQLLFGLAEPAAPSEPIRLRPYQVEGDAAVQVARAEDPRARVLAVAPTGAGKTTLFGHWVLAEVARGGRALVIAHRTELIAQARARLIAQGLPASDVGVVMGDGRMIVDGRVMQCARPLAPVQVCSIDTLRRRQLPRGVTMVVIDEAHRSLSKSYRDVVAAYPEAFVVGVTATPYRGDGRGLGDVYGKLVLITSPRALMAEGYLSEPRVFSHPHRADVSKVKTVAGDYDQEKLAEECDKAELLGSIVEHWQKHLAGVRTVAFAVNVKHSMHIAQMFRDAGIAAEHLDGETPADERAAILRRIDRGDTLVVSNCGVLCEGWDQPSVKGAILARPTKSRALYVQCAGRVLRPWQSATPIILDHAGCVLEHDLPHADVELTLDGRKRRAKSSISVKECRKCFGAVPSNARVCPYCSHPFGATDSAEGRELVERDGELVEVRPEVLAEEERQRARKRLAGVTWALACEQAVAGCGGREECARELNGWLRRKFGKREHMGLQDLRVAYDLVTTMLDEERARRAMLAPAVATAPTVPRLVFAAPAVEEVAAW